MSKEKQNVVPSEDLNEAFDSIDEVLPTLSAHTGKIAKVICAYGAYNRDLSLDFAPPDPARYQAIENKVHQCWRIIVKLLRRSRKYRRKIERIS